MTDWVVCHEIPLLFTESKGSLPCLCEPATRPYPETVGYNPQPYTLFL